MICPSCQASFDSPQKIVLTHCPFCQAEMPVHNTLTPAPNNNKEVIQQIIKEFSLDIYRSSSKFRAVLQDYFPTDKKLVKCLSVILEHQGGTALLDMQPLPDLQFHQKRKLLLLSLESASLVPAQSLEEGVNLLCYGMGRTVEPSANPSPPISPITPPTTPTTPPVTAAPTTSPTPFPSSTADFEIQNGVLLHYKGTDSVVKLPVGLVAIGEKAFYQCRTLAEVEIPDTVTSIGEKAFFECYAYYTDANPKHKGLTQVLIPSSVTHLGNSAFEGCRNLANVTLPYRLFSSAKGAFWKCKHNLRLKPLHGNKKDAKFYNDL